MNGETLYHFLFISSFSEYTVVDIAHITKIDPQTPPNRACLLSCGVSTGKLYSSDTFFPIFSSNKEVQFDFQKVKHTKIQLKSWYEYMSGVGAAWKTVKVEAGTTVAIFGLGAIGLAVRFYSGTILLNSYKE